MGVGDRAGGLAVLLNHSSGEPLKLESRSHDTLNVGPDECAKMPGQRT
jgi:hypothetical protein